MAYPKGFKKNIKITQQKVGPAQRQEILNDIADQGTFLPKGVLEEDMDGSFIEFVNKDLEIVIDGEKVPVIFLTIQRWAEFSRTWQFSDKYKDIKIPFITIVRRPDIQVGTNQAGLWNIPGRKTYTYIKVPSFHAGRRGVDLYKIPQPTAVDITYEVRLFCGRMRDLNKLHRIIQQTFQSRQHYLNVNGHPMPLTLESNGDESNIEDFENRRFYVQQFELKLAGYILDPDTFEVVPTIDRALVVGEIEEPSELPRFKFYNDETTNSFNYGIIFQSQSNSNFQFVSEFDLQVNTIYAVDNITEITIVVNGTTVFTGLTITTPITIAAGATVYIAVTKQYYNIGRFQMSGILL